MMYCVERILYQALHYNCIAFEIIFFCLINSSTPYGGKSGCIERHAYGNKHTVCLFNPMHHYGITKWLVQECKKPQSQLSSRTHPIKACYLLKYSEKLEGGQ